MCKKISKSISIFSKLRLKVPQYVLLNVYYTFEYPYLLYYNIIWGGTYNVALAPLIMLKKGVIRITAGEHFLAHTNDLFIHLGILKITFFFLYRYIGLIYVQKY